jgi:hypothetical protein
MILILASVIDRDARAFAAELATARATHLLTCQDLAEQRIRLRCPDFLDSTITVKHDSVSVQQIRGVINLLPAVYPEELFFYPPEEREYQSAEFHALLTFFLSSLPCAVVNRPTTSSLTGPYINPVGWLHLAERLRIPARPVAIDSDAFRNPFVPGSAHVREVECLAGTVIESSGTDMDDYTRRLAEAGEVQYLRAVYEHDESGHARLVTASTIPDARSAVTRRGFLEFAESRC